MNVGSLLIIDAHVHFIDAHVHRYPVFEQRSPLFEALVGDYTALPRRYSPEDYFRDVHGFDVTGTVWAEFMSSSPVVEVQWAQSLAREGTQPSAMIATTDFLASDVDRVITDYASIPSVRAVRQHLAWHPANPLLRFARRPDLMSDAKWRKGVALLQKYNLSCEIEIFAPQLPDFAYLVRSYPGSHFVLSAMGWPLDLTEAGFRTWQRDMVALSRCENVAVKIFALECIFGLDWTVERVRPWILETIALFGPSRCMFASHIPISLLACSFENLFNTYLDVTSNFSPAERKWLFHDAAASVYRL